MKSDAFVRTQNNGKILHRFRLSSLPGIAKQKCAILINPPVYDTQHWAEWSQPYGLLRIASLLKKNHYKRVELFDFLETDEKKKVPNHRINPDEVYGEKDKPTSPMSPVVVSKNGERLELFKRHYGKNWQDFETWLKDKGFDSEHAPDEVWISAIMTYWWEAVRDLTFRLKRLFGDRTTTILGGIYPTLAPAHAARYTHANIVVVGEIEEANDLWTDLSLYDKPPAYAIITPSRGCPFNCSYCAQKTINSGQGVRHRPPEDVVAEMKSKYDAYGIRDFAFYADYLLMDFEKNFMQILELTIKEKLPFRLHAPEGFDVRSLSKSQKLIDLMKKAHFQKIYLPVESINEKYLRTLNRKHVRLEHFVKAAKMFEMAGFRMRNLEVNAFVLYGLPEEKIDHVVKTIIFVSEIVGSIIPMLFTPVPTTEIFQQYLPYFQEYGWDQDLHMLNGKLYPFLELNEGSLSDYIDLQRLMFTLNTHYRSKSFRLFGDTQVSAAFRENLSNGFEEVIAQYREV